MTGAQASPASVRLKIVLATLALLVAWALVEAGPSRPAGSAATRSSAFSILGSIGVPDELLPFVDHEINAGLISALGQSVGADGLAALLGQSVGASSVLVSLFFGVHIFLRRYAKRCGHGDA
jgi:hypothetical protein